MKEWIENFWYIKHHEGYLYLDFRDPPNNSEIQTNALFLAFINKTFENHLYIESLWEYREILRYIFEKKIPAKTFKIGTQLLPYEDSMIESYPTLEVAKDYSYAKATFRRDDAGVLVDRDLFLAVLWWKGVKFGYLFELIESGIKHANGAIALKNSTLTIAEWKEPLEGSSAKLEIVTDKTERDTRAEINEESDAIEDMYRFKNTIFHVKKGELLYKKIPQTDGKNGRDIQGHMVFPKKSEDGVDLTKYMGEGVALKIIDGLQCLVSERDGSIKVNSEGRLSIDDGIRIDSVNSSIGNLKLDMHDEVLIIDGDIEDARKISANVKELIVEGKVYGGRIEVAGDTKVTIKGGVVKSEIVQNGEGKIEILSKTISSLVSAKKGSIHLLNSENSRVLGEKVEIDLLEQGEVAGKYIYIKNLKNTQNGTSHLLGEAININLFEGGGEVGITVSWFKEGDDDELRSNIKLKDISNLENEIENLAIELEEFEKKHIKEIKRYAELGVLMEDKRLQHRRGEFFLERKKLFTRVTQKIEQRREMLEAKSLTLHGMLQQLKTIDEALKNYHLEIDEGKFVGEMFVHSYKRGAKERDFFDIEDTRIHQILHTKVIKNDSEGAKFGRIFCDSEGKCSWNAYNYTS